jgi:ribonuclease P protein component
VNSRWSITVADRIRKRSEYQRVYDHGRKIFSKSFVLFYLENGLARPRLGITASRRAGGAVQRNRAKRLLREWFRLGRRELPPVDLVVNVREGMHALALEGLTLELMKAVRRMAVRGEKS